MRTRADLRGYQVRAALKAVQRARPEYKRQLKSKGLGLFVDMSLGKTAIALTAVRNMYAMDMLPDGVVLVAPIDVTKDTWQNEAKLWSHLKDMTFQIVDAKNKNERLRQLNAKVDIRIISYTLLPWLGKLLAPKIWRKKKRRGQVKAKAPRPEFMPTLLILDESDHIKGRGGWFNVLKNRVLKYVSFSLLLTGTPASHSLFDLWPQAYVIDRGTRLDTAFDRYRSRFFEKEHPNSFAYTPRPGAEKRIYKLLDDIAVRLDAEDWLDLPEIVPNTVYVDLPPRAMQLYRKHEEDMFIRLDNLKEVEAANAAILSGQCWQLAGGAIYDDEEDRTSWTEIHRAKLDALSRVLEQIGNEQVMIAYWFRHERERLQREYPDAIFMNKTNSMQVKDMWNERKARRVFINPGRSAYGLNMQYGGHHIVFFSQIWSGGKHDQLIGRLRRPDQESEHIITTYLTARNTVDEVISYSRRRRLRGQKQFLDALRKYRKGGKLEK